MRPAQRFAIEARRGDVAARCEAVRGLARAYLWSNLSVDEQAAAEAAMGLILDDPSPLVRRALADAIASSEHAPHHVVLALAQDSLDVCLPVLALSPLLSDLELIDIVAAQDDLGQAAVAARNGLDPAVAAAVVEVGGSKACTVLAASEEVSFTPGILARLVELHGADPEVRAALLERPDLPLGTRHALLIKLADALTGFVVERAWIGRDRAEAAAREACERVTMALAAEAGEALRTLVSHLRASGQLTPALLLRALLCGNEALVHEALAQATGIGVSRVAALVRDPGCIGLMSLMSRAGLPSSLHPVFRAALSVRGEVAGRGGHLHRGAVERVLSSCGGADPLDPLPAMLRRFAAEAARDQARAAFEDAPEAYALSAA